MQSKGFPPRTPKAVRSIFEQRVLEEIKKRRLNSKPVNRLEEAVKILEKKR